MSRILLIDDDNALRGVIALSLAHAGHEVIQALDGRQGVDLARVASFDVVVTDLIMPHQEGMETISILRKEQPHLPIIAISGGLPNSELYLQIAEKIGAKQVLAKPFAMTTLLTAIGELLAGSNPPPPPPSATA
jgi:DNA-binding response OmpR family regulator